MLTCPSCGKENREGARFCDSCAASLGDTAVPALEERKVVSVLFCDLVGFTAASEQADPEDVRARIRPYHARLRSEIERYGGTVEKFVGDAVMAVFGAPVAHEDDAERAVRAGLRILDAIAELNETSPDLELLVRVGINTGEAVVALGARPEQGEGIVTGDVVNTAARIQSAAPVDGVAVGEQTYRQTKELFDYEELEPVSVKGKTEAVPLWQAKAARSRFGTDITRQHTTPVVGRELETTLLIDTFERSAQQRSVHLVTVVGEPGVGKSRLVAELFAYVDTKPELTRWRQGRCLPYGEGITFWALGEIVKAEAGILESDPADVAAAKLEAAVSPEESDRQWLLQRLAPLVGAEAASPAERQELFTAWRRFLEGLAAVRPTVLVFEDLHWADEALLGFLEHLAEWAEGVPLLLLCTARPELYEEHPRWAGGTRNATTVNLAPLSDAETSELVSALATGTVLSQELERAILERAGGNPLYAEEFVRLLQDRGLATEDTALPDSLQALIAARLDTLPVGRKSVLQDAAVLGKVFWAGALGEMGGRESAEVELALHELARKELVRPARTSSMAGETEYAFWHALVRDVCYAQIPRAARAAKHLASAAWIERKAGERVEDLAEVLAHHYMQALDLSRAAGVVVRELEEQTKRFLMLAGDRALLLHVEQAEAYYGRALELLARGDAERPGVLVKAAEAAGLAGRWDEAESGYGEAIADFKGRGDNLAAGDALVRLSQIVRDRGAPARIEPLLAEAVDFLEREPPGPELVLAYTHLARHEQMGRKDYGAGLTWARKAIDTANGLGIEALGTRALQYHGYLRFETGDLGGVDDLREALRIGLEGGLGRETVTAYENLGDLTGWTEGPAAGLELFRAGADFALSRGFAYLAIWAEAATVWTLFELGDWDALLQKARRVVAWDPMSYTALLVLSYEAEVRLERGDVASATSLSEEFLPRARDNHDPQVLVPSIATAALIEGRRGDLSTAVALIKELEELTRGHPLWRAHQLPNAVRVSVAAGETALAEKLLEGTAASTFAPRFRYCAQAARAVLAEAQGRPEEALDLYEEVAERWSEHGFVLEQGHALHGAGRCLLALDHPGEAATSLQRARDLFETLGARTLALEARALGDRALALGN